MNNYMTTRDAGEADADNNATLAQAELVPLTYIPVPLQKQFAENQKLMQTGDFADFFSGDLQVPVSTAKALQHGPLSTDEILTPSVGDINKLLDPSQQFSDYGYALLDGPTAYTQARIVMPGVTTDIFKWWFLWHPLDKQRYMLWFPHAHVDNSIEDPERLADATLSYEKRLYNNPNHLTEFIGPNKLPIIIHFTEPTELGLDATALKRAGFTASASGTIRPAAAPDTTFILMLHLARDTDQGLELVTRYWIGAHPEFKRLPGGANSAAPLLEMMGMDKDAVEMLAYEMAVHDMTEFNVLKRILPQLYKQFGS